MSILCSSDDDALEIFLMKSGLLNNKKDLPNNNYCVKIMLEHFQILQTKTEFYLHFRLSKLTRTHAGNPSRIRNARF